MMHARNNLSHYPGAGWDCYTPEGADAAANANLSIGNFRLQRDFQPDAGQWQR